MQQAIAIVDSYAYGALISACVIQRIVVPMVGGTTDEAVIEAALPTAKVSLARVRRPVPAIMRGWPATAQSGRSASGTGHGLFQRHARRASGCCRSIPS